MAELAYNVVANGDGTHTVTRATGTSVLGANQVALVTVSGSLRQPAARAAVRAVLDVLRLDIQNVGDSADLPTSGSRTV